LRASLIILFILSPVGLLLGKEVIPLKAVKIKKAIDEIVLDGEFNEDSWEQADVASGFYQWFPEDSVLAGYDTYVSFTFDQSNLYVAIKAITRSDKYIVSSLRRDWDFGNNENVSIYIDPFNDKTNGFTFGITPVGAQREGLLVNGARVSTSWDNKWYSKTKISEDNWTAEIRIPFKSIRYNDQLTTWNLQILRQNLVENEGSGWNVAPQGFSPSSMAFAGTLNWESKPPPAGTNISLIPYVATNTSKDFENDEPRNTAFDIGGDAKVALSSSLNLDLTFNPDFSQVEVDQQITNLDRFELFFPERRQFFLENSDLFAQFGFFRSRTFFSRRIGLNVPVIYGARLSGKIGSDWRVGLLNVQTQDGVNSDDELLPDRNYTVAAFQRQIFGRSNISGIFVNKQAFGIDLSEGPYGDSTDYNRVWGIEYNLLTEDDRWAGELNYHQSYSPIGNDQNWAQMGFIRYKTQTFELGWSHELIGEDYISEAGFILRPGTYRFSTFSEYNFFLRSKYINNMGPRGGIVFFTDQQWNRIEHLYRGEFQINFQNTSEFNIEWRNRFVQLQDDFNVSLVDIEGAPELPEGSEHNWNEVRISYESDRRRFFNYEIRTQIGGFFNGELYKTTLNLNYRFQPYVAIAALIDYNRVVLPEPYISTDFWLIGPRIEVTFTDKIFWTSFLQYNEQGDNFNINSRLQWRFKPVSDLFIVYTDNYFPENFAKKNRALIFKLSYWFNI
jgi:hypothetical protein